MVFEHTRLRNHGLSGEGESVSQTTHVAYTYDGLSRVTQAGYEGGPSFTYQYDGAGDLLSLLALVGG